MPPVNGITDFIAKLPVLVREAELATAERIMEGAKERVPVDPNAETHLRDAIHVREDEDGVWVVAGNRRHFYGHMVENGTVHSPPHPFLIPAVEENTERFVADVREAMRKAAE